tara:strand:+ start:1295 stop:1897 length:603 start_codon:yes stop_codon:yes gene_type:complete
VNDMSVMALDIETKNMSHEIGGFGNTHMFQVSTVTTWDGSVAKVYVDEPLDTFAKSGHIIKSLRDLKYDLDEHFEKGGSLLGHNIVSFDLPVLKNAMDIYCIKKYLDAKRYIDTSRDIQSLNGERFKLQNLSENTLKTDKLMDSADAPKLWKQGEYDSVVEYCLKDSQIVYDIWQYGKENGIVKGFSLDKGEFVDLEVDW